jgi:membrane-associated phospholipid phosphatase
MTSEKPASVISLVFNPTVVAAFTFLILLYPLQPNQTSLTLVGICVTFGTLVPLVMMYQLSKRRLISDLYVSERKERAKPFAGAIASYIVGGAVLLLMRAPTMVTALMLCYAGNTAMMMLITLRWKISVHASGIAGPATALVYGVGTWAAVFFVLLIPVGWARLRLKAHTPWQILTGALVTIAATWIQLTIFFSIHSMP